MLIDELKLPLECFHSGNNTNLPDNGTVYIQDSEGSLLLLFNNQVLDGDMPLIEKLVTAVNSHLDLTASVSELKYLLKRRRDDNATLQTENARMREALERIAHWDDGDYDSSKRSIDFWILLADEIRGFASKTLIGDEKNGSEIETITEKHDYIEALQAITSSQGRADYLDERDLEINISLVVNAETIAHHALDRHKTNPELEEDEASMLLEKLVEELRAIPSTISDGLPLPVMYRLNNAGTYLAREKGE